MSEQCAECAKKDAQIRTSLRLYEITKEGLEISQELNATLRERRDQAEAIVRKLTGMSVSEYLRKEGKE